MLAPRTATAVGVGRWQRCRVHGHHATRQFELVGDWVYVRDRAAGVTTAVTGALHRDGDEQRGGVSAATVAMLRSGVSTRQITPHLSSSHPGTVGHLQLGSMHRPDTLPIGHRGPAGGPFPAFTGTGAIRGSSGDVSGWSIRGLHRHFTDYRTSCRSHRHQRSRLRSTLLNGGFFNGNSSTSPTTARSWPSAASRPSTTEPGMWSSGGSPPCIPAGEFSFNCNTEFISLGTTGHRSRAQLQPVALRRWPVRGVHVEHPRGRGRA